MRSARTLLIGVVVMALFATGCEWHFETLDGNGGPGGRTTNDVGIERSAAIIYNGRPHVFYYDHVDFDLRHAYYNGVAWAFEVLDGHQNGPNGQVTTEVAWWNTAILYNGRPHVFYQDADNGNLRHAYYNGVTWAFEVLDGAGGPNGRTANSVGEYSSALVYNGRPHVFYYDRTDATLRHAYYNGVTWAFETLDGNGGPNGRFTGDAGQYTSVLLYNGRPHVFYAANSPVFDLRHAYYNGFTWVFETLDGSGGSHGEVTGGAGHYTSVVLYNGRPHAFYQHQTMGDLRHGYWNGVFWAFETLDGAGGPDGRINADVGEDPSVVLYGGRPHVFYYDNDNRDLRRTYWTGSKWMAEYLDGHANEASGAIFGDVGSRGGSVLYNGRPDVFYYDASNNGLRHAWFG